MTDYAKRLDELETVIRKGSAVATIRDAKEAISIARALLKERDELQIGIRLAIKGCLREVVIHETQGNRVTAAYAGATARHLDNMLDGVTRLECDNNYCGCPDGHPKG